MEITPADVSCLKNFISQFKENAVNRSNKLLIQHSNVIVKGSNFWI